ncbi:DUF2254 domain-containing protein [Modestobacter versicolor]|uniref:DUF2254 domain-containing protein n=1 Tax=Modestobacter versicolor TaxID=429133 RepID=UPI0034DEF7D7
MNASKRRRRGPLLAVTTWLRGALWPIPAIAIVVAVGIGIGLPAVDALLESSDSGHPLTFVFGGGPSAARDLLAAIAGSLISVTGLIFSLTVVALQLGSSQYSPRLLQTFATDRVVQLTLAQLTATFVYALTVLRTVRTESATETETAFVPRLSITVAYLLTLGSVLAVVLFLGHLARALRVETMLRDVHDEAGATLDRVLPGGLEHPDPVRLPSGPGTPIAATSSGFLIDLDEERLVSAAARSDVVVLMAARIGDSVVTGTPLAHVWAGDGGHATDTAALQEALGRSVRLDFERSPARDIAYSLRKVVDITVRALSPGINDPTTAVHALSHASALLGDLVSRPLWPDRRADADGVVRLVVPQWTPDDLVDLVLEEPLHYASGQPAVLRRIAALLREVAWRAPRGLVDHALRDRLRHAVDLAAESTEITAVERRSWEEALDSALIDVWPADRPE